MQDTPRHEGLRNKLIDSLADKGIKNEIVLTVMRKLPRHFFISPDFEHFAYEDKPFSIGEGQTISQPYTVAYQTELIEPEKGLKVLEIGTGSGYQAAVLSLCGLEVYSIERFESLHLQAKQLFKQLQIKVNTFLGDGTKGVPENAPYDRILVTAAAPSIPKTLFNQLKIGGKLIIPVGKDLQTQKMVRITKTTENDYQTETFDNFSFVPLVGQYGWKG